MEPYIVPVGFAVLSLLAIIGIVLGWVSSRQHIKTLEVLAKLTASLVHVNDGNQHQMLVLKNLKDSWQLGAEQLQELVNTSQLGAEQLQELVNTLLGHKDLLTPFDKLRDAVLERLTYLAEQVTKAETHQSRRWDQFGTWSNATTTLMLSQQAEVLNKGQLMETEIVTRIGAAATSFEQTERDRRASLLHIFNNFQEGLNQVISHLAEDRNRAEGTRQQLSGLTHQGETLRALAAQLQQLSGMLMTQRSVPQVVPAGVNPAYAAAQAMAAMTPAVPVAPQPAAFTPPAPAETSDPLINDSITRSLMQSERLTYGQGIDPGLATWSAPTDFGFPGDTKAAQLNMMAGLDVGALSPEQTKNLFAALVQATQAAQPMVTLQVSPPALAQQPVSMNLPNVPPPLPYGADDGVTPAEMDALRALGANSDEAPHVPNGVVPT